MADNTLVTSTDIYDMNEALFNMQKNMMEETDEETLALGTYGWFNSVLSKMITSNIKVAADNSNEVFPTRAKYDKNVIYHAINSEITDINAIPASMPVLFCIEEESLTSLFMEQGEIVTLSDECKFMIGDYEYHFDYPVLVSKQLLENQVAAYTAKYDITFSNPLSDVENPFLPSPYILKMNGSTYIFIACKLRQVERTVNTNTIQSSNSIENKTYLFEFENELATFYILATDEGKEKIKITPYFEGTSIPDDEIYYCWYTYLDETTVRVKFDSNSYMPKINTVLDTVILTTHGSECNFEYMQDCPSSMDDTDNYTYSAAKINISPQGKSEGGKDKKTVKEIKSVLPKQALSRGNIINQTDIYNYFNRLETTTTRLTPKLKVDNQIMRSYYLYLLLKDSKNVVIPTNTIDINFDVTKANISVDHNVNHQYFFKQGTCIGYNGGSNGVICNYEEDKDKYDFLYTLPYKIAINTRGPMVSFYMDAVDKIYKTYYSYINNHSPIQFICSSVTFTKKISDESYKMNLTLHQNIDTDYGLIVEGDEGEVTNNIMVAVLLYDKDGTPYRYFLGECKNYDIKSEFNYEYTVEFITDDIINEENNIKLSNGYSINTTTEDGMVYGYFPANTKTEIYVFAKFDQNYGLYNATSFIPNLEGYTCTNMFTIPDGLNFFDNFTEVTNSVADIINDNLYRIRAIPVIRYEYANNDENIMAFFNKLIEYKTYINSALNILENAFSIDFKFYNTYGPSNLYNITSDGSKRLDKTNITLNFEMMIKKSADDYTKNYIIRDIQSLFEDFTGSDDKYIPQIISYINNKYENSIYYLAYKGFNKFDSNYQNFFVNSNLQEDIIDLVPEFVCLNRVSTDEEENIPDINITVI